MLQPLLVMSEEDQIAEAVVTLTNEGTVASTDVTGRIQWSRNIPVQWNEFDEKLVGMKDGAERKGVQPVMSYTKGMICIAAAKSVMCLSRSGRVGLRGRNQVRRCSIFRWENRCFIRSTPVKTRST